MILYRAVRPFVVGLCRLAWRMRIDGRVRVPRAGACILAPSHRSMMDIPFLAVTTRRRIRFMGKREVFEWPVLGRMFHHLGGFPVDRDGSDVGPVRAALRLLDGGEALAVFPEGTRQSGSGIAPLQSGTAYLAIRTGAPVVPVGIAGSEDVWRTRRGRLPGFGRVAVVVGEPLVPPARTGRAVPRREVAAFTEALHARLQEAHDAAEALRRR